MEIPMNTNTLAVSIVEAARRAGVSRSFIYAEISCGKLKIRKAGRRSLISVQDLEEWFSSLPKARQNHVAQN
jgi:excisionase family DNA binding protein